MYPERIVIEFCQQKNHGSSTLAEPINQTEILPYEEIRASGVHVLTEKKTVEYVRAVQGLAGATRG